MIVFLLFSIFSFYIFNKIIDISLVPRRIVLEDAFIYRSLSEASRTRSYLYLRVGLGDYVYDHVMQVSSRDIRHLDLSESRKLWVAVDSGRNNRFVWGVYDNDGGLMISRKDILQWARFDNIKNYLTIVTSSVLSLYLLLLIFRNGFWNRFVAKRKACENRAD